MKQFDLFADALWQYYETGKANLRVERDDGYVGGEDISWYFTSYRDFPAHEKRALQFARGRVLDAGCGAGRHSLYLQRRGLRVTAIDVSPPIVELARARGVRDAQAASICQLRIEPANFDTVLLFGNNLGICGTIPRFRRMLRDLQRVTTSRARILATTRQPSTTNPRHRSYLRRNLKRGRYPGQIRVRLLLKGKRGLRESSQTKSKSYLEKVSVRNASPWFELLLLAPTDLMRIAAEEGWELAHVFPLASFETGYSVVLEKVS